MKTKATLFFTCFLWCLLIQSQSFKAKLNNHQQGLPEMDFIIMPFDIDNRISIGKLNADGTLNIEIPNVSEIQLPANVSNDNLLELIHTLDFKCANPSNLNTSESLRAFNGGYFALWHNKRNNGWAGSVFAVSDTELIPWIEDDAYMQPVQASYYKLIYVSEDAVIKTTCNDSWESLDIDIDRVYIFDLNLKKGFNLIEYQIQDIFITNSDEITNKPNKVLIKSPSDILNIIWYAKYF